jgi:hypothetical protein
MIVIMQTFASPGSFLGDELPTLTFRALLMENGAERIELARA